MDVFFNVYYNMYIFLDVEVCLRLQPLKLRLCNVTLEGLGLPHEVIAHFMADPDGKIDITFFGTHRVIVLPR